MRAVKTKEKTVTLKVRALDLFCGAGGSSWGAREAGVEIAASFDIWPLAGETHDQNFPESEFISGRLEDVDVDALALRLGPIHLILASPECTNHSPAKGNKPRCERSKNTAFQVVRFAKAFQPRWLIIENVVNMRKWSRYAEFEKELEDLGYNVLEQLLNAVQFGVPQSRRRLFLICDKERTPSASKPPKSTRMRASDVVDLQADYSWSPLRTEKRSKATLERADRGIAKLGMKKAFLLVYYGSDGAGGWQALNRSLRTVTTVDRFAIVKPDPSHGHVMRMLQVPELRAAMGMSSRMKFESGTRRDRIKMLGNAVCPPVMKHLVKHLVSQVGADGRA